MLVLGVGCEKGLMNTHLPIAHLALTAEELQRVANKRVYFGHQSVGDNIVQGLRDLMADDPRLALNLVHADEASAKGPVFLEFHIGSNGDPGSKDLAYAAVMDKGAGDQDGIAIYKYCFVDINASSDIESMFQQYAKDVKVMKHRYPGLTFVHVTVPLTTVEAGWKAFLKSMMGRTTERDVDTKRNQYNDLLRQTYAGREPIFDLAEAESTLPNKSRSYVTVKGKQIYILASEYSSDGGHLNEVGRRWVASHLLAALANL